MIKTLNKLSIGDTGVISSVGGEGKIRRRLLDMGVTPGAEVLLRKKAPLGDPIEVTLRGYELTLRMSEAAYVMVEVPEEEAAQTADEAAADVSEEKEAKE